MAKVTICYLLALNLPAIEQAESCALFEEAPSSRIPFCIHRRIRLCLLLDSPTRNTSWNKLTSDDMFELDANMETKVLAYLEWKETPCNFFQSLCKSGCQMWAEEWAGRRKQPKQWACCPSRHTGRISALPHFVRLSRCPTWSCSSAAGNSRPHNRSYCPFQ